MGNQGALLAVTMNLHLSQGPGGYACRHEAAEAGTAGTVPRNPATPDSSIFHTSPEAPSPGLALGLLVLVGSLGASSFAIGK